MNVDELVIDVVNRWSTKTKKKRITNKNKMNIYYAQPELLVEPFLKYGEAI